MNVQGQGRMGAEPEKNVKNERRGNDGNGWGGGGGKNKG